MSIARAILYDPPILVLDEATSNVDAESEQAIQHRLSTLREADRILVFDRGKLIEQGSHEELIQHDGQYANLVRIQGDARSTDEIAESTNSARGSSDLRWLMPNDVEIRSAAR